MNIAFCPYEKSFFRNRLFKVTDIAIGDDMLAPGKVLEEYAAGKGHTVMTIDMDRLENFDAVVFIEMPREDNRYFKRLRAKGFRNLFLMLYECPMIKPDNWDILRHRYFKKIFTWRDDLLDGERYLKSNWSYCIPNDLEFNVDEKVKFCTMITSHKTMTHPQDLYSERIRAIRWFEKYHPAEFDLYGIGWDRSYFQPPWQKLNRFTPLTRLMKPYFPAYRGVVDRKRDVLRKYRFAICYENQKDMPGYITEKIFDCFFAGCVPVYWGAPNIEKHVPKETFIDRRAFKSYEDLYDFLKNMPDSDFRTYLEAIRYFLKSDRVCQFKADYYAKTIIDEITSDEK